MYRKRLPDPDKRLQKAAEANNAAIRQLEQDVKEELQAKRLQISGPDAAAKLTQAFENIVEQKQAIRDALYSELQLVVWNFEELMGFWRLRPGMVNFQNCKQHVKGCRDKLLTFDSQLYSGLLQTELQKLDPEALNSFASHLAPPAAKPEVKLERKQSNSALSREIMALVYSYCSLETCVALRQVDSQWYQEYQRIDMKSLLKARNPWITPDDGLTWGDCVLLFVSRLQSSDWVQVDSFADIIESKELSEHKTVVAGQLEYGEKLPANFEGLGMYDTYSACSRDIQVRMDPWTLESWEKKKPSPFDRVGDEFEYRGGKVTLAPEMQLHQDPEQFNITLGESTISLRLEGSNDHAVFPLDQPNYNNCVVYQGIGRDVGGVFSVLRSDHFLVDFDTRKLVKYSTDYRVTIVASYNGLIWVNKKGTIVPTLKDMQTPDKIYYRKNRHIRTASLGLMEKRGRFLSAYTSCLPRGTLFLIDLSTGIVTKVEFPGDWSHHDLRAMFIGYLDGVFQARCMSKQTYDRYREEILEKFDDT